jgi:hypothetical protein
MKKASEYENSITTLKRENDALRDQLTNTSYPSSTNSRLSNPNNSNSNKPNGGRQPPKIEISNKNLFGGIISQGQQNPSNLGGNSSGGGGVGGGGGGGSSHQMMMHPMEHTSYGTGGNHGMGGPNGEGPTPSFPLVVGRGALSLKDSDLERGMMGSSGNPLGASVGIGLGGGGRIGGRDRIRDPIDRDRDSILDHPPSKRMRTDDGISNSLNSSGSNHNPPPPSIPYPPSSSHHQHNPQPPNLGRNHSPKVTGGGLKKEIKRERIDTSPGLNSMTNPNPGKNSPLVGSNGQYSSSQQGGGGGIGNPNSNNPNPSTSRTNSMSNSNPSILTPSHEMRGSPNFLSQSVLGSGGTSGQSHGMDLKRLNGTGVGNVEYGRSMRGDLDEGMMERDRERDRDRENRLMERESRVDREREILNQGNVSVNSNNNGNNPTVGQSGDYREEGEDWSAIYNPKVPRKMQVKLNLTLNLDR